MRTIQASEAKTQFLSILDDVQNGETVVISRHGKNVARISPDPDFQRQRLEKARAGMRALRQRVGKLSIEEILSARDEGRD
jgi:prevent-host-death family protein